MWDAFPSTKLLVTIHEGLTCLSPSETIKCHTKRCVSVHSRKARKLGLDWVNSFWLHIITQKSIWHPLCSPMLVLFIITVKGKKKTGKHCCLPGMNLRSPVSSGIFLYLWNIFACLVAILPVAHNLSAVLSYSSKTVRSSNASSRT